MTTPKGRLPNTRNVQGYLLLAVLGRGSPLVTAGMSAHVPLPPSGQVMPPTQNTWRVSMGYFKAMVVLNGLDTSTYVALDNFNNTEQ